MILCTTVSGYVKGAASSESSIDHRLWSNYPNEYLEAIVCTDMYYYWFKPARWVPANS